MRRLSIVVFLIAAFTTVQARRAPDVAWSAEVKGRGSDDEVTKKVIARDIELTNESGEIRYMVYAFDAKTGRARAGHAVHADADAVVPDRALIQAGLKTRLYFRSALS